MAVLANVAQPLQPSSKLGWLWCLATLPLHQSQISLISWRVFICGNSPCSQFGFREESDEHAVWRLSFVTFKNGLRINVLINTLWWLTACFTLKSRQPCSIERSASFYVVLITKLIGRQGSLSLWTLQDQGIRLWCCVLGLPCCLCSWLVWTQQVNVP